MRACAVRSTVPQTLGRGWLARQRRCSPVHVRPRLAAAAPSVAVNHTDVEAEVLCRVLCPICLTTEFGLKKTDPLPLNLRCDRCSRSFDSNKTFVDLTVSSGEKDTEYTLSNQLSTTTFQNPWVGFVYERGWRQTFARSGFPGPDQEFDSALEFLKPVTGGSVMDLSCGSGLFTRRFLTSGAFSNVVAVDYSAAMLTQTAQFVKRMEETPQASLQLIRADVARLPFPTGSFDAVFAGAAIHCWPNPAMALTEISRVLSPGGIFVMSTFTYYPKEVDDLLERPLLRALRAMAPSGRTSGFNYWTAQRLEDTCRLAGLENFEAIRRSLYIMVRVNKPLS